MVCVINLNPKQPVTNMDLGDMKSVPNDYPNSSMYENTPSDSKYRLNSNDNSNKQAIQEIEQRESK
jgi:hypothetical protein